MRFFAPGDAWNLLSEGKGVGLFPAGQSSRRGQCTGTDPFVIGCTRACVWINMHMKHSSAPQPPQPPQPPLRSHFGSSGTRPSGVLLENFYRRTQESVR